MYVYFDIETIPAQRNDLTQFVIDKIKPPGNIKKEESVVKWWQEQGEDAIEEALSKTSFDGLMGEIISIAWAINDEPAEVVYRHLEGSEEFLLRSFLTAITRQTMHAKPIWIGHNIVSFDLPFLHRRCVVNGTAPRVYIPFDAKPWSKDVYDTCEVFGRASQDKVCRALGIQGKPDDIDGSRVWEYVQKGMVEKVAEYNKDDVEKVRMIHKRAMFR